MKFDEFPDDLFPAEQLGDPQGQIGGGHPFTETPGQSHPDDLRGQKIDRLTEHAGLSLDPADPPADDPQPIDHGGVGIGADQRIREKDASPFSFPTEHDLGQVFEIDLVDDADRWRNDLERIKGLLSPFQEFVALTVSLKLDLEIGQEGIGRAGRGPPARNGRSPGRPGPAARSGPDCDPGGPRPTASPRDRPAAELR